MWGPKFNGELEEAKASYQAFKKWRGERPTSGYTRDLTTWDYETRDLWQAWQAACKWQADAVLKLLNKKNI